MIDCYAIHMTEYIALIAEIQGHILRARQRAAETNDPRKRDAYRQFVDVIELKVRELDQLALDVGGRISRTRDCSAFFQT